MKNGQKCFKRIGVLLTTFLLIVMCLAVDTTTVSAAKNKLSKTKITLTQGKKYRLKVKGTKKKVKWSSTKKSVVLPQPHSNDAVRMAASKSAVNFFIFLSSICFCVWIGLP